MPWKNGSGRMSEMWVFGDYALRIEYSSKEGAPSQGTNAILQRIFDCDMTEVKTEIRKNGRFTVREVEALLGQLSQDERRFGEE